MTAAKKRTRGTDSECIDLIESTEGKRISVQALHKFCERHGIARGKDRTYNLAGLLDARAGMKQRERERLTGEHATLRAKKLQVEIEILETKRDELRGRLIEIEEVRQNFIEYGGIVNEVFSTWEMQVSALTHDPALVDAAERLTFQTRQRLADAVKASAST